MGAGSRSVRDRLGRAETLAKLVHVVNGMRFDAAVDQAHADPNALTRLDHNRAKAMLAKKPKVDLAKAD